MSQYLLINKVKVQNANAISGFTWGFPAITHFLGFSHNLFRKLQANGKYESININGCAVVVHNHHVHAYKTGNGFNFSQNKTPHYLEVKKKAGKVVPPSVIEEGKMNMTVSLVINCEGYLGNRQDRFQSLITKLCFTQRLAGGTILDIDSVEVIDVDDMSKFRYLKHKLLPGFILQDRSHYLEEHYQTLKSKNESAELLDAWLDFSAYKQKARPKSDLIDKHFEALIKSNSSDKSLSQLAEVWQQHKQQPYEAGSLPRVVVNYFDTLEESKTNKKLIGQWAQYVEPTEKTDADWERMDKPKPGYLVPIVTGYKAISPRYDKSEIDGIRAKPDDNSVSSVCFVESVHSVGEWQGVHRIKDTQMLANSLWYYGYDENEPEWYLCNQGVALPQTVNTETSSDDDYE